jgi:hypothetical protein
MTLLPLATLVAGVGAISVWVDRRLQARKKPAAPATAAAEETATAAEAPAEGQVDGQESWSARAQGWYNNLRRRQPTDLPARFRAWAVATSDDQAVKDWLNALSEEGLQSFTKHLGAFCSDMGFELTWLLDQQLERTPHLAQSAQRIVLDYCRACQQSAAAQEDLEIFKKLQALEQHPTSKKNQALGEQLFAKMIEAELVSGSMSSYLAISPKERQQRLVEAIKEASERDTMTFNRLVKDVLMASRQGENAQSSADEQGARQYTIPS